MWRLSKIPITLKSGESLGDTLLRLHVFHRWGIWPWPKEGCQALSAIRFGCWWRGIQSGLQLKKTGMRKTKLLMKLQMIHQFVREARRNCTHCGACHVKLIQHRYSAQHLIGSAIIPSRSVHYSIMITRHSMNSFFTFLRSSYFYRIIGG